jgi:hypothetical protein
LSQILVADPTRPPPEALPLCPGPRESRSDPLGDPSALELGNRRENVHLEFPGRRGCVDALGERDERNSERLHVLEECDQVLQVATESIQSPDDEDIEPPPLAIHEEVVKCGTTVLRAADTEKTRDVLARAGMPLPTGASASDTPTPDQSRTPRGDAPRPGHGRNGAATYAGAAHVAVPHAQPHHGDGCPLCVKGHVYRQRDPAVLIRLSGQPPITGTIYDRERLRCNLCGEVFTADPPPGIGSEKYDATTGSIVALLKYGSGMPFHRLERLQANVQIPLPASTQWEIVEALARTPAPGPRRADAAGRQWRRGAQRRH